MTTARRARFAVISHLCRLAFRRGASLGATFLRGAHFHEKTRVAD